MLDADEILEQLDFDSEVPCDGVYDRPCELEAEAIVLVFRACECGGQSDDWHALCEVHLSLLRALVLRTPPLRCPDCYGPLGPDNFMVRYV